MNEQPKMMNQQHPMNLNQNMMGMSQMNPQPQMIPMNRSFGIWPPPPQFQNPNPNPGMKPPSSAFKKPLGPRSNWKGKRVNKPNDKRRNEQQKSLIPGPSGGGIAGGVNIIGGGGGGVGNLNFNNYQPPTLNELQQQNRLKTRKFFSKKKFNKNVNMGMNMNMGPNMGMNMNMGPNNNNNNYNNSRSAPFAPRNTTSFLIRAKKSGGIASLVSPSPMTPAVLPTPIFSPSREDLVDMAKEEWGVDGYGSMKGLIRLRSPGHDMEGHEDDEDDEGGSSESDVEEHVEVERRLDHDLSRFEMIYNPNNINVSGMEYHNVLENRVDDQDTHIAQLEEENLILKERLFLMERELGDLRRRMKLLERRDNRGDETNEEVVENDSENESGSRGDEGAHSMDDNTGDFSGDNDVHADGCSKGKGDDGHDSEGFEVAATTDKTDVFSSEKKAETNDGGAPAEVENVDVTECKQENENEEVIDGSKNEENNKDGEENSNYENEDKCLDMEVKAADNSGVESCEAVVAGKDICMEDVGVAKDETVSPRDVANSRVTEVNES